ncbi:MULTISPECIES: class I SAM-dependent RNA methyltransferase [unclassified Microbacterium]|uniref:class I SAM-dependent RNA methyltransferase n=1 Tax=unclassified Microbacterium TaxID=2609290 RepID=UPI00097EB987|nr:TRAM domain-containing protein [Microbacterium sp. JB110]RCS61424.1 class I SAM-dependent RNA methyltransferase [Microbacterium sp. JB110]SJM65421.1 23S rRNA (Uracil-5-)-methyltransferase RumA [Frigoribacterium sp. JB110]
MEKGDQIELDITGVAHGGVFVAREPEGRVVFVADAIPGERVRARITEVKKSFARAETVDVLDASPDRVPHVWPAVAGGEQPGGADLGHIALPRQRELKAQVLREAFAKFADLEIDAPVLGPEDVLGHDHPDVAATRDGLRYRTRISLHVDDRGRIGPFAPRSHRVVEVDDHPLATPEIAEVAAALRSATEGRVDLVQPADGGIRTLRRPARRPGVRTPREEPEVIVEAVAGREFQVDAGGFWQVHRAAAEMLTDTVRQSLGPLESDAWNLDLYGGVGLFAATLGELAEGARLTTVESSQRASLHAEQNLADFGAEALDLRVEHFLTQLSNQASLLDREMLTRGVALLDPPRSGAGRDVVEGLAGLGPSRVAYIACDPVALARDVGIFRGLGYELESLKAFDIFPQSHHVEAVAVLAR